MLAVLPDSPESCAAFLGPREHGCLMSSLRRMQAGKEAAIADGGAGKCARPSGGGARRGALDVMCDARVLLLAASMLLWDLGYYGVIYWLPIVLNGSQ